MTDKTVTNAAEREALSVYLKDCDKHAIVPDVGGAWHAAFQAGRASLAASAGSEPVDPHVELRKAWTPGHKWEWTKPGEGRWWHHNGEPEWDPDWQYRLAPVTHPSPPEGMVGGWRPIAEAPKDDTVVDIWHPSCGGERCPDMRRVDLGGGNVFYDPVLAGPTCVRDATHFMIVRPPIAAGGGKDADRG